ncbi:MAG: hypothetical protein KJ666_05885 [Bacteroidetes bacterium]|nr:hypothetical protein [Bacteroidota bacterium]MBU2586184.1 hypothetical protein [Bacteroidota bacterium]
MDYSEDSHNFYLNEQNKKKRKELEEKYGADYHKVNEETPPEIESQFLDNIKKFEEQWENAETKKVIEILGNPHFKKLEEIKPEELSGEIDKVLEIYNQHQINIDALDEVTEEDFYRFLTEELPQHETTFIQIEGMTTNYIYEEFHPSNKLDAKQSIEDFLLGILNNAKKDFLIRQGGWISKEKLMDSDGTPISLDDFITKSRSLFFGLPSGIKKVEEREINFIDFDFGEKNLVDVDLKLRYKMGHSARGSKPAVAGSNIIEKLFRFRFELERSEYGGFDIVRYELRK